MQLRPDFLIDWCVFVCQQHRSGAFHWLGREWGVKRNSGIAVVAFEWGVRSVRKKINNYLYK